MNKETFPIWNFPSHVSIGFSQIAFYTIVLLKDDRKDFVQEEQLDLPYWTMILAICVVVDESKCVDTPILKFSMICEHLPFLHGYKQILRLLFVQSQPSNLETISMILAAVIWDAEDPCSVNTA